ncbi:MAG: hypothetical protein Q8R45_02565 [Brevundimonas sp.]|uniref:hypothetical protein n=2 Tax=Brevundimonas sp. TaxID=1871086 RepID=UPI002715B163|nr:hypothetical protein [Brevundimonas sp.]MDO9587539.1 hypothetical protein [Brevundimonas sp.]MDP3368489.1 hypothetical protein [Brevundimonas sp.]MDP3655835.1 hypothetical protein [Brevundimonas sp.]MDZ4112339.1 hypothetical protein [Brevundimonas sp.]
MRAPAMIVLSGLALAAAACATVESSPVTTPPTNSVGAPAPVVGHDWFYHLDGDAARLVYGLAESDDMRLGLDCDRASGRLVLSAAGGPDAQSWIHIEAGGESERFPARSEPSELHDGVFLTAVAATDAPVFQRFRSVGWLALWQDGELQAYAPHPESAPDIEKFFTFCG